MKGKQSMSVLAPNHFLLNSSDNMLSAEYWSDQQMLTVTSSTNPPQTYTGSQITTSNTPIGQLVSVATPIDPETESILSFLLPAISLLNGRSSASFQTFGVEDRHTNPNSQSLGPVYDNYAELFPLSGTANIV
jgi:hypothetical protein